MVRLLIVLTLVPLLGTPVTARDSQPPDYDPRKQVVTPQGQVRGQDDLPTEAEMSEWKWHSLVGVKPIPPKIQELLRRSAEPPAQPPEEPSAPVKLLPTPPLVLPVE